MSIYLFFSSAGVGRTGTYIAIDAMIDKIKQEGKIDIYNFAVQMRRERHLMVQTVAVSYTHLTLPTTPYV